MPFPGLGNGTALPRALRRILEALFHVDLAAVRLHQGPEASDVVAGHRAHALTFGNHVVLGGTVPALESMAGRRILAHEIAHVIQQAGPFETGALPYAAHARGPPRPEPWRILLRTHGLGVQCLEWPDVSLPSASDVAGAVVDFGEGAWDTVSDAGGAVVDFAADSLASVVEYFAPGLLRFLRGGFAGQITDLFCSGVDALIGALIAPLAELDLVSAIEDLFSSLEEGVLGMGSGLAEGATAAVGALMEPLVDALDVYGDPILEGITSAADTADGIFSSLWENVGVPVLDFLESVGGAVWDGFNGLITWLDEVTGPLRDAAEDAWDWLMAQFNLAWDSTSGIRTWLEEQAASLWETFLEVIEPIKTPLMAVAATLVLLSPLGPIVVLTQILPPLYDKIVWLWNHWNTDEILVEAREVLANEILPGIIGFIGSVGGAIASAASWLAGAVAAVTGAFASVLGAFGGNACLASVTRVVDHVAGEFQALADWAEGGFTGLGDAVRSVLDALGGLFQPILDFLVRLILVALNPVMLPIAITAAIWLLCPDELKPPVIRFVLEFIIQFIRGFGGFLTGLGPLAGLMKAGVLGFLGQLQSQDDDTKVAASNKVANIAAGGGPQFVAGYAVGLLEGVIDGILDPIKLIAMLVRVIAAVAQAIGDRLAPLVSGGLPPVGAALGMIRESLAIPEGTSEGPAPASGGAAVEVPAAHGGEVGLPEGPVPGPGAVEAPAGASGEVTRRQPGGPGAEPRREGVHRIHRVATRPNPPAGEAPPRVEQRFGDAADAPGTLHRVERTRSSSSGLVHARAPPAGPGPRIGELRRSSASTTEAAAPPAVLPIPDPASANTAPDAEAVTTSGETPMPPSPVEGASAGAEEDMPFEVLPGETIPDEVLIESLSPATIGEVAAGGAELAGADAELEAGGESEARESGATVSGLAGLLADVWESLVAGARGLGRSAADALLRFLRLPDYDLGNKIGYVAGMVLLEVLLAVVTGGAWLEASAVGRFLRPMVRLLDAGGEILGAVARGFRSIRGPFMRGMGAARGFLGRFRIVRSILDKLDNAARALFRFGDEAAGAAGHGSGRVDDVARHADDVGRHADDAGRHADDVGRRADDAADRSRRSADDAAREAAEKPMARARAIAIVRLNDPLDTPVPLLLAQLNVLRGTYPWIDGFRADPTGVGRFEIHMIASDTNLGPYTTDDETSFEFEGQRIEFTSPDRAPWRRARAEGRPVDLSEEFNIDIDEPMAVGEAGISRAEAARRAMDPMNRQFLDSVTNRITKGARPQVGAPPGPRLAPGEPRVRLADNPSALATHRFAEVEELNTLFAEAVRGLPPGLSPGAAKAEINRRLWALIRGERAAPAGVADAAQRVREAFGRIGLDPATRGALPMPRSGLGPPPGQRPREAASLVSEPGRAIDAPTRHRLERYFGTDLAPVRLHTGPRAEAASEAMNARAFAHGRHVVMGRQAGPPSGPRWERTLVHEVAHVIQQSRPPPPGGMLNPAREEAEAEAAATGYPTGRSGVGATLSASSPHPAGQPAPPVSLERPPDPVEMSDDALRRTIKEIHLWKAGQVATTQEVRDVDGIREILQDELNHRNRERAKALAPPRKPGRGDARNRKRDRAAPVANAAAVVPAPRAAVSTIDMNRLSPDEQADELQRMDEWLAVASEKDPERGRVQNVQSEVSSGLWRRESVPMRESHTVPIARVDGFEVVTTQHTGLNRYQAMEAVRRVLRVGRFEADHAGSNLDILYEHKNSAPTRARVSEFLGGAGNPGALVDLWTRANRLLYDAEDALDAGDFQRAARIHAQAMAEFGRVRRGVRAYFGDVETGAGRAVTGLKVVKTGSAVVVTVGTGGAAGLAVGGGYAAAQSFAQQASEVHYGLRDRIDWGEIAFDGITGVLSGYLGGKLGNLIVGKLLGRAATAGFGRKALTLAVGDYIAGRGGSTIQISARAVYDLARGKDVTWEQFLGQLADEITNPRKAALDIIMGRANRFVAARVDQGRRRVVDDEPPPPPAPAPAQLPGTNRPPPAENAVDAARNYADRHNGRVANDDGLVGIFERTRDQPTLAVDRRAAAAELRQIDDILAFGYEGRPVTRVRVVPHTSQQRTPDLVLEFGDGTTTRVEIRAFTAAPRGHTDPHAPLRRATESRRDAVSRSELETAVLSKAATSSSRRSQLDVPLRGVAVGGRVSIQSHHRTISAADADAAMLNLASRLGSHVQSVAFSSPSGTGAGRVTLVYVRRGTGFVR